MVSSGLSENDVSPVLTPLFHAGGLFAFLTPLLYAGGRIILAEGFDAEQSLRVIQDEGCTVILGVPTLFQMWLDASGFAQADFSAVHFFMRGGARRCRCRWSKPGEHRRTWFSARAMA